MSKAFTRESDDVVEPPLTPRPLSVPGGKNYLTPQGAQRLREELERLMQPGHSPKKEANDIAKRKQQIVNQRILQLQQSLAAAVIVPPPAPPWEQVVFGATVTVRDQSGEKSQYRIVGIDETDLDRNWVSWSSPIARALLKARLGQRVQFRTPAGEQQWEIVGIGYE
jgi:transcription elongation factor GreB